MKDTILIVDDEPANLRMLERLFHKNYRVLTANSGAEALSMLERETVALILTDQRMPGMTGTELLCESMQTQPDVAKIIVTGYSDIEALIEAINTARVYKYVSKPWDPVDLKKVVLGALREYKQRVEQHQLIGSLVALVQASPDLFCGEAAQDANAVEAHVDEQDELISKLVLLVKSQPDIFALEGAHVPALPDTEGGASDDAGQHDRTYSHHPSR